MEALLHHLVSEVEMEEIRKYVTQRSGEHPITGYEKIADLTVKQLSGMAFTLIRSEYAYKDNDIMHECILSAEAIDILTKRAMTKKLSIF